jgi:hypothetical protein
MENKENLENALVGNLTKYGLPGTVSLAILYLVQHIDKFNFESLHTNQPIILVFGVVCFILLFYAQKLIINNLNLLMGITKSITAEHTDQLALLTREVIKIDKYLQGNISPELFIFYLQSYAGQLSWIIYQGLLPLTTGTLEFSYTRSLLYSSVENSLKQLCYRTDVFSYQSLATKAFASLDIILEKHKKLLKLYEQTQVPLQYSIQLSKMIDVEVGLLLNDISENIGKRGDI